MPDERDQAYMERCIGLARQAEGRTHPNPLVGAIVVADDGVVVGQGFHRRAGDPHAEAIALAEAGERAAGATLYINLEPCCHFGRTPPCADRIIASGIRRLVAGMADPNPLVSGGGFARLTDAGIAVEVGVLAGACRWLNRAFVKWHEEGLPWLCLKMASTLDGRIADFGGRSRWLTSPEARARVHAMRNVFDAVMVGGATATADNPSLTVRDVEGGRNPVRVIVDTACAVSPDLEVCRAGTAPTYIYAGAEAVAERAALFPAGVELVPAPTDSSGRLDLTCVLADLGGRGLRSILCEGGGRLAGALLSHRLVDEIQWFVAARLLGDPLARPSVDVGERRTLDQATALTPIGHAQVGPDFLLSYRVDKASPPDGRAAAGLPV